MLAYILSHGIQISLQSRYAMEMIRFEFRFGIVYTTIVYTRPTLLWTCVANAHFQCVNSRYAVLNIQEYNYITPKSNNVIYSM